MISMSLFQIDGFQNRIALHVHSDKPFYGADFSKYERVVFSNIISIEKEQFEIIKLSKLLTN